MVEATVSLLGIGYSQKNCVLGSRTCLPATIMATESPSSQKRSCSRLLFFLEPSINQEEIWASRSAVGRSIPCWR